MTTGKNNHAGSARPAAEPMPAAEIRRAARDTRAHTWEAPKVSERVFSLLSGPMLLEHVVKHVLCDRMKAVVDFEAPHLEEVRARLLTYKETMRCPEVDEVRSALKALRAPGVSEKDLVRHLLLRVVAPDIDLLDMGTRAPTDDLDELLEILGRPEPSQEAKRRQRAAYQRLVSMGLDGEYSEDSTRAARCRELLSERPRRKEFLLGRITQLFKRVPKGCSRYFLLVEVLTETEVAQRNQKALLEQCERQLRASAPELFERYRERAAQAVQAAGAAPRHCEYLYGPRSEAREGYLDDDGVFVALAPGRDAVAPFEMLTAYRAKQARTSKEKFLEQGDANGHVEVLARFTHEGWDS
ncbi:MAG: hypothetical protein QM765_39000 [Myxococcales bacterium]